MAQNLVQLLDTSEVVDEPRAQTVADADLFGTLWLWAFWDTLCSKLPDGMGVAVSGALLLCRRKVCARLPPLLSILFLFQLIVHVSEPVQSTTKTGVKSIAASGKKRNH